MKNLTKVVTFVLAVALVAVLAACGMSNNPTKTKQALEDKQYTVEAIIGDDDLDSQAELDGMSDEMHLTAGELVAMIAAYKGEGEDISQDFVYLYYFKDGASANKFWDSNQEDLDNIKSEYSNAKDFEINKSGSVVYFGTKQAISDAM